MGDKDVDAAHWMRKAAEGYYPVAMNGLGVLLNHGRGVATDNEEAFKWITRAAEKGNVPAMTNLGVGIHHGQINESLFESIKWLRKAAEQDDQYGLMHLSVIMASGNEAIVVDVEEALRLVDRSIQLGNKMAIYAKLQLYGFAVLDAEADSIRQKLTNESMESKIRAAFLEVIFSIKILNLRLKESIGANATT